MLQAFRLSPKHTLYEELIKIMSLVASFMRYFNPAVTIIEQYCSPHKQMLDIGYSNIQDTIFEFQYISLSFAILLHKVLFS